MKENKLTIEDLTTFQTLRYLLSQSLNYPVEISNLSVVGLCRRVFGRSGCGVFGG